LAREQPVLARPEIPSEGVPSNDFEEARSSVQAAKEER